MHRSVLGEIFNLAVSFQLKHFELCEFLIETDKHQFSVVFEL